MCAYLLLSCTYKIHLKVRASEYSSENKDMDPAFVELIFLVERDIK